jgi:hypothetical protein
MEGSLVAYKVFTNGSVLNASEINDNLMNQSVMVFSNATARSAAITSPLEGMLTWLEDTNKYQNYNGSAWVDLGGSGITKVVSTTKTDPFTHSTTTFTDITGLNASITPSSASNKVLVTATVFVSANEFVGFFLRLLRGSTDISVGDAAGSRARVATGFYPGTGAGSNAYASLSVSFLDSPATTSSTTYKLQIAGSGASLIGVNRSVTDSDSSGFPRGTSTITLMEVAG